VPLKRADIIWLAQISLTLLLALLPFSGYIAALPYIQLEWSLSNTQSGIIFSAYLVGFAASSLVMIPLTDRVAPARLMALGVAVMVLSSLLFPLLARDPWSAGLLRLLSGAGHVLAYVLGVQLVTRRFASQRRGLAVGIFVSTGYAGTTLSYTVIGLLLDRFTSWRHAYLIAAATSGIGLLLAIVLAVWSGTHQPVPSSPERHEDRPQGSASSGRLDLTVLSRRSILLVILAYSVHTAELYLARLWFPLLLGAMLVHSGRSTPEATAMAATLSGLMFMMGVIGVLFGGMLSDRIGRSAGAAIIFVLSGLCSFVAGWLIPAPPLFLIGLGFAYGFLTAADSAIYSTAAVELSPPGRIGSVQAAQSFVGFGVGAIVPVLAGTILDVGGSSAGWGLAFSFNGLLATAGIFALLRLRRSPDAAMLADGRG
jgi:MFS family permease